MKYSDITLGRVEAVWNKMGGESGVRRFLAGELELVERPLPYEINAYGHLILTVVGKGTRGEAEAEALAHSGFDVCDRSRWCLGSSWDDGYDKLHRLADGETYSIAIILGSHICTRPTTETILLAADAFNYVKPPAGIIPRLRELLSNRMLEKLGLWYITALHDPISDYDGDENRLRVVRTHGKPAIDAVFVEKYGTWAKDGAFAFLVPTK